MIGSYYETLEGIGPGIDISHYGAPYKQMLGVPALGSYTEQPGEHFRSATAGLGHGMLYRYQANLGQTPWTGAPADDPRMVRQFTTVRSTYRVRNLGGDRTAARAAEAVLAKARALFSGNTVRKIGTTGWTNDGKVGYEVILATNTRAGEIKRKNFQAGQQAAAEMGGNVSFYDAATAIPGNSFVDAPPTAPPTPEMAPSSTPAQELAAQNGNFLTQRVAGLPVWALGLIGVGVVGGVVVLATRKKKAPAPTPNKRRRRRRSTRRRRRRSSRRRR